jgi:hypothetical protein
VARMWHTCARRDAASRNRMTSIHAQIRGAALDAARADATPKAGVGSSNLPEGTTHKIAGHRRFQGSRLVASLTGSGGTSQLGSGPPLEIRPGSRSNRSPSQRACSPRVRPVVRSRPLSINASARCHPSPRTARWGRCVMARGHP